MREYTATNIVGWWGIVRKRFKIDSDRIHTSHNIYSCSNCQVLHTNVLYETEHLGGTHKNGPVLGSIGETKGGSPTRERLVLGIGDEPAALSIVGSSGIVENGKWHQNRNSMNNFKSHAVGGKWSE